MHLYLSDPSPGCRVGNLIGDFVKGPLENTWPKEVYRGLQQHRRVDVFAHNHPAFQRSRRRLDRRYGLCRGIMVDIFYDHILARDWPLFHPLPLADFAAAAYRDLELHRDWWPASFQPVAERMIRHDWLSSYRDEQVISRVLERVAARLSRPTPMAEGLGELRSHYTALQTDCQQFLAASRDFLRRRAAHSSPS